MRDRSATSFALSAIPFLLLLGGWQIVTSLHLIQPIFLPSPFAVFSAIQTMLLSGGFGYDIVVSAARMVGGFAVAGVLGIPIGVLIGRSHRAEQLLEPLIDCIRYTPIPAFVPLLILWFGVGESEKIVVIAASVFFQLVLMVANSVTYVPRQMIGSAQTLGASRSQVLWRVILPYAQPRIVDDLRVSLGWAWSGLMLAEIVGSVSGIGFVMIQSQRLLQTPRVIAALLVVGCLGLLTDVVVKRLHRSFFPWMTLSHGHS